MIFFHIKRSVSEKKYASKLKEILSDIKYPESVFRKILRNQGYYSHHLNKFLSVCVEPKKIEPRNFKVIIGSLESGST